IVRKVNIMKRVDNVREKLEEMNIDALLVTNMYNVRYLTNFTGTTGLAVITKDKAYFVTDFRYTQQAAEQAKDFEIIKNEGLIYEEVAKIVKKDHIKYLGFEETNITYATYTKINEIIDCELKPITGLVEKLREVKTEDEIDIIQEAVNIAEKGFDYILGFVKPGITEIEVANELDFYMRKLGATEVSFDTIVASGVRSAMPHGVASDKIIENGDMVTIDFGCYYKGYVSDMTRTFAVGDPGEELKEIYEIVYQANKKVAEASKTDAIDQEMTAEKERIAAEKAREEAEAKKLAEAQRKAAEKEKQAQQVKTASSTKKSSSEVSSSRSEEHTSELQSRFDLVCR